MDGALLLDINQFENTFLNLSLNLQWSHQAEGWLRGKRLEQPHHWVSFVGGTGAHIILPSGFMIEPQRQKSTPESTDSTHSPLPQPPFVPSVFHPFFHTTMIYNQYSCGSWELISKELCLVPILSVGAITIRLWIISLDHCFLLLCWLGAIHLPPPPKSQPLLNCLSHSLLPPPPQPQSHLLILICPLLHCSILLKSKLSWSQNQ